MVYLKAVMQGTGLTAMAEEWWINSGAQITFTSSLFMRNIEVEYQKGWSYSEMISNEQLEGKMHMVLLGFEGEGGRKLTLRVQVIFSPDVHHAVIGQDILGHLDAPIKKMLCDP